MSPVSLTDRLKTMARIDWSRPLPQPSTGALVAATAVALAGSLAVNAALVGLGTSLFPSTRGYPHFRLGDYATLTVVGVVVASAAWPVVTRISPAPRWLFFRLAVLVTLVLWAPDVYLLVRNQPTRAVMVLMVMHLAVALVTYNALVRLAPPRERAALPPSGSAIGSTAPEPEPEPEPNPDTVRRLATWLAVLVGVEFVLGVAALVAVPTDRPTGWIPHQGSVLYLAHALVGLPLTAGAVLMVVRSRASTHLDRLSGWIGGVGVALAGLGGLLAVSHPVRLLGVAFMLVGPVVAGFGYLIPTFDRLGDQGAQGDAVPD